jgi:hypothetical protein
MLIRNPDTPRHTPWTKIFEEKGHLFKMRLAPQTSEREIRQTGHLGTRCPDKPSSGG